MRSFGTGRREQLILRVVVATLTLVLASVLWCARTPFVFPLDDAYITLHNAQVLRSGQDPNYGVPALIGATSLVHLALVTLATTVVDPPVLASFLVTVLGVLLYAQGLAALAFRYELTAAQSALVIAAG
jgi:hypothetical protein